MDITEYGIYLYKSGTWLTDCNGNIYHSISIGVMQAQLKHYLKHVNEDNIEVLIMAFADNGEPSINV